MTKSTERKILNRYVNVEIYRDGIICLFAWASELDITIKINEAGGFIEYSCHDRNGNNLMKEKVPFEIGHDFYIKNLKGKVEEYLNMAYGNYDIGFKIKSINSYFTDNDLRIKSMESFWMFLMNQGVIK